MSEPLKPCPPYIFDRYVDGILMAEGAVISNASSLNEASAKVASMFRDSPRSVFVLLPAAPSVNKEAKNEN